MAATPPSPTLGCVQGAEMAGNARTRTHARRKTQYSVAYSASSSEYRIIWFETFWAALIFWLSVKRHPGINNVRLEIKNE
jgi:hypothetical protein